MTSAQPVDLPRVLRATDTAQRVRVDVDEGVLIGTRCAACAWTAFPQRAACPRCHGVSVSPAALPTRGELRTWTRVWVPVEGIAPPYVLGLVWLGGVGVFGHVRGLPEDVTVPAPVRLRVSRSSHPQFWFEPASQSLDE